MKLTDAPDDIKKKDKNIVLPQYDVNQMKLKTLETPEWVHFGGGNLYRCFHAKVAQDLLNQNQLKTGIIVAETMTDDLIETFYHQYDNKSLTVVMKEDGTFRKEIIASTATALFFHPSKDRDVSQLENIFEQPSLKIVTLTITEKGYLVNSSNNKLTEETTQDISVGPNFSELTGTISKIVYLLFKRCTAGACPIAMLSTDNFSNNGDVLKESILTIAQGWYEKEYVNKEFLEYLCDEKKVSYPLSMIDRITPGPSQQVSDLLKKSGFEEVNIIQTERGSRIAPFVNTEQTHYFVIEDNFPNGRPNLELSSGVTLTDRLTVEKTDKMKVCTCLNPLHTALAIFGCLFNYQYIHETIRDPLLLKLVEKVGIVEGLPVVENPEIIDPKFFIEEVIYKRLGNQNIPDTPQRIVSDTSQKMKIRFGETIKSYRDNDLLTPSELVFIPLVIAGWCRYLMGIDDQGSEMTLSPDPLLNELRTHIKTVHLGEVTNHNTSALKPILSNPYIFGVNLYDVGLGEKIETYFALFCESEGAVRKTLSDFLTN